MRHKFLTILAFSSLIYVNFSYGVGNIITHKKQHMTKQLEEKVRDGEITPDEAMRRYFQYREIEYEKYQRPKMTKDEAAKKRKMFSEAAASAPLKGTKQGEGGGGPVEPEVSRAAEDEFGLQSTFAMDYLKSRHNGDGEQVYELELSYNDKLGSHYVTWFDTQLEHVHPKGEKFRRIQDDQFFETPLTVNLAKDPEGKENGTFIKIAPIQTLVDYGHGEKRFFEGFPLGIGKIFSKDVWTSKDGNMKLRWKAEADLQGAGVGRFESWDTNGKLHKTTNFVPASTQLGSILEFDIKKWFIASILENQADIIAGNTPGNYRDEFEHTLAVGRYFGSEGDTTVSAIMKDKLWETGGPHGALGTDATYEPFWGAALEMDPSKPIKAIRSGYHVITGQTKNSNGQRVPGE